MQNTIAICNHTSCGCLLRTVYKLDGCENVILSDRVYCTGRLVSVTKYLFMLSIVLSNYFGFSLVYVIGIDHLHLFPMV